MRLTTGQPLTTCSTLSNTSGPRCGSPASAADPPPATESRQPMTSPSAFGIHHLRRSSSPGPQLWLLHGVYTDHHLWETTLAHLDPAVAPDVVALDSPGHGTAGPASVLPSLDGQVESLAQVIREEALGPVTLAGHSWGGMLGLRLALSHPELLHGLVLVNTPLRRTVGTTRLAFEAQRTMVAVGLPLRAYGRLAARSLYGESYFRQHPGIARTTGEIVASLGRKGTVSVIRRVLLEPDDSIEMLRSTPVATTLVAGEDDYVGAGPVPRLLRSAGHTLLRHPGGHMGPAEAPEVVAAVLRTALMQAST